MSANDKGNGLRIRDFGRGVEVAIGQLMAWAIGTDVHPLLVTAIVKGTPEAPAMDDRERTSPRGFVIEGIVLRTTREGQTYLKRQSLLPEHLFLAEGEVPGLTDQTVEDLETQIAAQRTSYLASLQDASTVAS